MSFTCEECRQKQNLDHGPGYPFMGISRGRCEDCGNVADCEDLHGRPTVSKSRAAASNFMQRVGDMSCIRCDFKTDARKSFQEQTAEMSAHLVKEHPDWMIDGGKSIKRDRLPGGAYTDAPGWNAAVGTFDRPTIIPPDPSLTVLIRLFLEKYDILADEDKTWLRQSIQMITDPVMVVKESE